MKKKYIVGIAIACIAIIAFAMLTEAYGDGKDIKGKIKKFFKHRQLAKMQNTWRNVLNFTKIEGILEYTNGSYYINDTKLIIKRGFSKSDIDRDGSLERMDDEMKGLLGEEIRIDGFFKDGRLVVLHINGIWAR